jgi:hypothetical protein
MLNIPTYTMDPEFTTNLIDLGGALPDQMVTGSVASLASDADGESLEFMKMDGPDWLTVNLDGTYSGTPTLADAGINEFSIRAADNHDGYAVAIMQLNVVESLVDWDNDGLPNDWELAYFGGETNAVAEADSDGDEFDNLAEYISGFDPTNSESFFAATYGMVPAGFVVSWNAVTGRTYGIWHCGSLTNAFTNLQSGIDFPQNSYTDTAHTAEASVFYKLIVQLVP